jgi:hypothetical protein
VVEAPIAPEMRLLQQAEQLAREVAAMRPEIALLETDLIQAPSGPVVVVSIETPRDPSPEGVSGFEAQLRARLDDPTVRVVVRRVESSDITAKGRILYGAAHFSPESDEQRARRKTVEDAVRARLEAVPQLFVTAIDAVKAGPGWSVRAEALAPRMPTPAEVRSAEKQAGDALGEPVAVSLLARLELVVSGSRYERIGAAPPIPR